MLTVGNSQLIMKYKIFFRYDKKPVFDLLDCNQHINAFTEAFDILNPQI